MKGFIYLLTSPESGKKLRMRTLIPLILNFFLHNQNLKVPIEKVWKYGFIKKDKFELRLRRQMKPKENGCRDLVRFFYSHLEGGSHQFTVKRFLTCCCWPNILPRRILRLLPLVRVDKLAVWNLEFGHSMIFHLCQVFKSIMRTDESVSQWVIQWVSQ